MGELLISRDEFRQTCSDFILSKKTFLWDPYKLRNHIKKKEAKNKYFGDRIEVFGEDCRASWRIIDN